jgi:hypothetical protein
MNETHRIHAYAVDKNRQWHQNKALFDGQGVPSSTIPVRTSHWVEEIEAKLAHNENNGDSWYYIFILHGKIGGYKKVESVLAVTNYGMQVENENCSNHFVPFNRIWEIKYEGERTNKIGTRMNYVTNVVSEYEHNNGTDPTPARLRIARDAATRHDLLQSLSVPERRQLDNIQMTDEEIETIFRSNEQIRQAASARILCRSTVDRLHSTTIDIVKGRTDDERKAVEGRMPLLQPEPNDPKYKEMLADLHQMMPNMNWAEQYVVSVDKVRADSECIKQHAHYSDEAE